MKELTAYLVLIAPLVVLLYDFLVHQTVGYEASITGVVRDWAERSAWPEVFFAAGALAMYAHFFRGWV